MAKVGITGGIGAGKSLIASMVEALGYPVYYADSEAKRLMSESPYIKKELVALLGNNAYISDTLNRPYIAKAVFGNDSLLQKINTLVHPAVKADFATWAAQRCNSPLLFLESALIYEAQLQATLDAVIRVTAPLSVRVSRVMQRDLVAESEVLKRVAAQQKEEESAQKADFTIYNDNQTTLTLQLETILEQLKKLM